MNGRFIVLEGADGSGKTTQFRLLTERLKAVGYAVEVFDFPRYEEPSGYFVKSYLNGAYGPAKDVNPYTASMFYALDRYAAADGIRRALAEDKLVLCNRYTGSNMAHQGAKFGSEAEKRGYFLWADSLEFQLLGIPRPNLNIFLRVPAEISYQLVERKAQRDYTKATRDEHEADIEHLRNSVATYDLLCNLFPKDYQSVDCVSGGELMSIAAINDLIWEAIQPHLSADIRRHKPKGRLVRLDEPSSPPGKAQPIQIGTGLPGRASKATAIKSLSLLGARQLQKNRFLLLSLKTQAVGKQPFKFYQPKLPTALAKSFAESMSKLATNRQKIIDGLKSTPVGSSEATYIAQSMLPMATLVSVNTVYDPQQLPAVLTDLKTSKLEELTGLAASLVTNQSDQPAPTGHRLNRFKELLQGQVPHTHSADTPTVSLIQSQPRLELALLGDLVSQGQEVSAAEATALLSKLDYDRKAAALAAALAQAEPNDLNEQLSYQWELLLDEPSLRALVAAGAVEIVNAQTISPRYGYDSPEVLEEAGLAELFSDSFDESLRLFSALQAAGREAEAAYATLAGHKSRWLVSTNYRQLTALYGLATGVGAPMPGQEIARLMIEAVAETHPIVASSLASHLNQVIARQQPPELLIKPAPARKRPLENKRPRSKRRTKN